MQALKADGADFVKVIDYLSRNKIADVVLLDTDPLHDIHNTTRISGVFLSGKYLDRAALDKLLSEAEPAANSASEVKAPYLQ